MTTDMLINHPAWRNQEWCLLLSTKATTTWIT